jgi:signal transduction histidine kinase
MRLQTFVVLFLVGMIPCLIFSEVLAATYYKQAINERISELSEKRTIISNMLISSNYFIGAVDVTAENSEIEQIAEAYRGRIVVVDNSFRILSDTYGLEEGKLIISEQVIDCAKGKSSSYIDKNGQYVEFVTPVTDVTTKETEGIIIMSFSIKDIQSMRDMLINRSHILYLFLGIIVAAGAFLYSTMLTKPFARVTASIDHATEGNLSEPISIGGYREVEQISEAFNRLAARLQTMEDSRQEFVSNVSHELKTPITSIKILSDSLLSQEDAPAELYREFLVDIAEEIERENKIINDLLSLVKLDKKAGALNICQTDINELLEQILKRLRPIANERNIELIFESFRPVMAEVDEVKLSLAINNLIENAIKYNYDDGWVRVSLNADHKYFYVTVSDSGVGIPEELQSSIFERFYRVDKARSRETGGTGLGLSITRNAVLMHRGSIKVYSKEKEGATFTIRIPLNYIA